MHSFECVQYCEYNLKLLLNLEN